MGAAIVFLLAGMHLGRAISAERLLRISILIYLIISVFSGLVLLTLTPARGEAVGRAGAMIALGWAVGFLAISAGLIVWAQAGRRPYPWSVLRWTFLLATCGVLAPSVSRFSLLLLTNPLGLLVTAIFTAPPLLQVALLWWPHRPEHSPSSG